MSEYYIQRLFMTEMLKRKGDNSQEQLSILCQLLNIIDDSKEQLKKKSYIVNSTPKIHSTV